MSLWFFLIGIPLFCYGSLAVAKPELAAKGVLKFPRSFALGAVLAVAAWFFTAYELDTIGIEAFDKFLKMFPAELWILAAVLSVLTIKWMDNLLPIRAVCALMMLFPAEMFPMIRLSETPLRLCLVVFAYVCIITGMFGMFYPWRIFQFLRWRTEKVSRVKMDGAVVLSIGVLFAALGTLSFLQVIK